MKIEDFDLENMTEEQLEQLTGPEEGAQEVGEPVGEEVQEPAEDLPVLEVEEDIPVAGRETNIGDFYPEVAEALDEKPVDLAAEIRKLQDEIAAMRKAPKNHVAGKPGDKVYVRLGPLNTVGKVPQQQHDLATILTRNMPVGQKFTEAQVFEFLNKEYHEFPQLRNSKQDVTYLLRYYRGLKRDGPHAGFIARDFLSVV